MLSWSIPEYVDTYVDTKLEIGNRETVFYSTQG